MNFLNKIAPNAAGVIDAGRDAALQAARQTTFNPKWGTRLGQCDPPATTEQWLWSIFCTPCAAASTKSKFDGSDVCYNCLCWHPIATAAWVRKGYNVTGTCGDDLMCGIFCMPCITRRIVTEVETRKEVPLLRGGPDEWQTTLFACGACEFFQALLCPFCPAAVAKQLMQPDRPKDMCFDWICLLPPSVYGQVRHMYGIKAEFGLLEDLCLPVVCYPCAISQASREAQWRLANTPQVYAGYGAASLGQKILGALPIPRV